jgi:peptidoglycan/xylan/chitin deacetylase (PgdA/CDA1 family)/SAM-dependent methyltransferase
VRLDATSEREAQRWNALFTRPDPWSYDDPYERTKRGYALEALAGRRFARALEVGCAEGHLTAMLAACCDSLMAVDIAAAAVERARERCREMPEVHFERRDAFRSLPVGPFDLVVCSEVLYYARHRFALRAMLRRLVRSLAAGGDRLLVHTIAMADRRTASGFDFHELGADSIARAAARSRSVRLLRELDAGLYRVQVWRRHGGTTQGALVRRAVDPGLQPGDRAAGLVRWGGCDVTVAEARHLLRSSAITVLLYHRIAAEGPVALAPYRVTPEEFARQVDYLRRQGFESLSLDAAAERLARGEIGGRAVVFTFDDGYLDFATTAWPILRSHGFTATVFVPTALVGERAIWDAEHGEPAPLMSWADLARVRSEGATIASHGHDHRRLAELAPAEVRDQVGRSRAILEEKLGAPVTCFCYPWGSFDEAVCREVSAAGYRYAVAGSGFLRRGADPHLIPRQEALADVSGAAFAGLLAPARPAPLSARLVYRWRRAMRDRRTYMEE